MSEVCKKLYPRENQAELVKFFGDPRGRNGEVNKKWFAENMVLFYPPYPVWFGDERKVQLKRMYVHKKCLKTFEGAFAETLKVFGLEKIKQLNLDVSGGSFNYRLYRGGSNLSTHSYGCAIDMDPERNPFPKKWNAKHGLPLDYVEIMEKHGFWWRGRDGDIDPMHFQCCWR